MSRTPSSGLNPSYGHPVVGDIKVVTHYGPYRDFAGVKFPTKIIQYHDGKPTLDLTVTAVTANPPVDIRGSRPMFAAIPCR